MAERTFPLPEGEQEFERRDLSRIGQRRRIVGDVEP